MKCPQNRHIEQQDWAARFYVKSLVFAAVCHRKHRIDMEISTAIEMKANSIGFFLRAISADRERCQLPFVFDDKGGVASAALISVPVERVANALGIPLARPRGSKLHLRQM
jgi:hypothetical protein